MAGDAKSNAKLLWKLLGLLAAFWVVIGLVFGPKYFRKLGASWYVDACLDKGGCWDAQAGRCEMVDSTKCASPRRSSGGSP